MAYLIGNNLKSGVARPSLPKKPSLPGKPVGPRTRPAPQEVDPVALQQVINDANALRYATVDNPTGAGYRAYGPVPPGNAPPATPTPANLLGGQGTQTPASTAQFPKNPITFQQARDAAKARFPAPAGGAVRTNDPDDRQIPMDPPAQKAVQPVPPVETKKADAFDWLGLANNPYKELAKLLPQGTLRNVVDGVGTGFQYLPSTLVRDYVLPVPGMLAKNGWKALDDHAQGNPLQFDPKVSAYDILLRYANALRRGGDTKNADQLKLLLYHPVGKAILSAAGEIALDPLTYVGGAGVTKVAKAFQALKAAKAVEAADAAMDIQRAQRAAQTLDVPPARSTVGYEKPPQARALDDEIRKAQSLGDGTPTAVADEVPKGYTESAQNAWESTENLIKSATTPGKGGVSPVGRAFQKHAGNPSRAGTFVGEVSGNASRNTEQGAQYISDILSNPQTTYKVRHTDAFGDILDVRMPDGTGARWSADGKTFIGFLEKYTK